MSDSAARRRSRIAAQLGWQRLWAASGVLTVVLFACGLLFGDLLGTSNYPALDASASDIRAYFLQNASEVRALSFFHVLSAVALVAFAAYVYGYLRRESRAPSALAAFALSGGAIAAAFLLMSALCYRTLAEPTVASDAPLAHALVVLSYLAGGPAIAVPLVPMVAAVAATALRERLLARWTGWLGVVTAICGAACASTFLGPTNNHSATYGILLLGAVLVFAWQCGHKHRAHRAVTCSTTLRRFLRTAIHTPGSWLATRRRRGPRPVPQGAHRRHGCAG